VQPIPGRKSRTLARVALALLIAGSACNMVQRGSGAEDETDVVAVTVVNHHSLNVTVFNVVRGRRDRLGEVTAASSASFRLHLRRLNGSEVQLLADPIGSSRTVRSDVLHVSAGDVVQWVLESDLARSHIEIR